MDFKIRNGVLLWCSASKDQFGIGSGEGLRQEIWDYDITIPATVKKIEHDVFDFEECEYVDTVRIPESVTEIEGNVFSSLRSLEQILVDERNSCFSSLDGALYTKDLSTLLCCPHAKTDFMLPTSVTSIADDAFESTDELTHVILPDTVTDISEGAFSDALKPVSLKELQSILGTSPAPDAAFPEDMEIIGAKVLFRCEENNIPDEFERLEADDAFWFAKRYMLRRYHGEASSVVIPDGVTYIGDKAFSGCDHLTSVVLPDSVRCIGNMAFEGCSNLTSIELPESVTHIGEKAFE